MLKNHIKNTLTNELLTDQYKSTEGMVLDFDPTNGLCTLEVMDPATRKKIWYKNIEIPMNAEGVISKDITPGDNVYVGYSGTGKETPFIIGIKKNNDYNTVVADKSSGAIDSPGFFEEIGNAINTFFGWGGN
ncbi:MAG: hypothetical protein NWF07_04845 [Candidatus Bathyarchaeota archaeon]|nr:hypothetical protein [Candidatus Bathyarchaeota archaeon]